MSISSRDTAAPQVRPALERSFSTPMAASFMRLKISKQQQQQHCHHHNPQLHHHQRLKSSRSLLAIGTFRHSHRDKSSRLACGARKHERRRSISPPAGCLNVSSCSSASDSAFSQSRSTLGSESGHSSACSSCARRYKRRRRARTSHHRLLAAQSHVAADAAYANPDEHFKIVWHKLTYRVPQKRLACLTACLATKLGGWWRNSSSDGDKDEPISLPNEQAEPTDVLSIEIIKQNSLVALPPAVQQLEPPARLRAPKQRQVIFADLNGCVKSGQLSAILGPSGAGKTTFLKCLTSDISAGVTGNIGIQGGLRTKQQLKLCIIPQKDYLFENLTVMENLLFASRIKNTQRHFEHEANVHRVAGLLGLQACLKLKTSRLSGGQAKRVSIAQELLSQPDILILDEPTSGLDSLTCYRTVSVLRELADLSAAGLLAPLAIVMTIHQPQIKIFNLFHHVYIMSSLGSCVYEGPTRLLLDTVAQSCQLLPPADDDQNPASFIIDLASGVYGREPIDKLIQLQRQNFHQLHLNDQQQQQQQQRKKLHDLAACLVVDNDDSLAPASTKIDCSQLDMSAKGGLPRATTKDMDESKEEKLFISDQLRKRRQEDCNFWLHTGLLVRRLWISMWRDSLLTTTRVAFHLMIPFVFYFVYSQKSGQANACPHVERELDIQDMVSDSNIQRLTIQHDELILSFENVSLFFLLLYSFSMCVLAVTALSFPLNMQILLKETTNGWYTMPRFVMAKTLADLPIELTMPMVSVSIAYALTGQPSSYLCWRMLAVTAVMTLCSLISQTQGLLFGAYFMNNVQAAVFVSQASTLPWIMLSGFTTRVSQLPHLLQWLSFGSIYRLGIESIVAVRYGFGMCPCDEELVNETPPKIVGIPDQLKSVMGYYLDAYSANSNNNNSSAPNGTQVDVFGKIASTLARANTYGTDIVSCRDVRPFIMSAREVDESTLPVFLSVLVGVLVVLRILLFYVVKVRAS